MSAGSYDITCEQGTTFSRTLTVKDASNNPRDFTNYTARMQVRKRLTDTEVEIELTTENGRIAMNSEGQISLSITATDTAALSYGGVYDLEIIDNSGTVERLIQGNFILELEVTR